MKFAFCIFEYIPFGGMQKNLLRIARECLARGHQVNIYAGAWEAELPGDLSVSILPVRGLGNHRRCESFIRELDKHRAGANYDTIVGFNKMPGLDVYYAADPCLAAKVSTRSGWYRMTGRCRTYLRLEKAVFDQRSRTEILLISEQEKPFFMKFYSTPEERFHLLPPGISRDCLPPDNADEVRTELRRELSLGLDQNIILMVGSDFKRKGVDRAIRALASLPDQLRNKTILLVLGEGKTRPLLRLAKKLRVGSRLRFMGGREDAPRFLVAADLLLHPAYQETAGAVLIEALAAGLPVLASEVCGYSYHVHRAGGGELVPLPFEQTTLNQLLLFMLTSEKKAEWQRSGREYVANTDVFSRPQKAADIIEQVASC